MKDRFLFEDSFEQHLREKSDEFKMYPSDKIWAGIDNALHARRKRFIAFMAFLITGILLVAGTEFFGPTHPVSAGHGSKPMVPVQEPPTLDLNQFTTPPSTMDRTGSSGAQTQSQSSVLRTPFVSSYSSGELARGAGSAGLQRISLTPGIVGAGLPPSLANFRLPIVSVPQSDASVPEAETQVDLPRATVVGAGLNDPEPGEINTALERPASKKLAGNRFGWEIYITPTVLSRRLSGLETQRLNPNIANGPITLVHYANVNGLVDNSPVLGYDIGGNLKYRLSKRLSVKAGLALNFSRYYIQTYNTQPNYASPVMNTYLGYIADSLVTQNAPSGFGEPKSQQRLQNQYFTLSVPVGVEWKVAGKGRLELYLGASVQPGYLLNRNAYTITNDYGSYEKNPASFNRWNLNTGAEAFMSYRVGNVRWQLGPQVRYQLFSSYKSGSPLRENLVIYGIRLGFSKSKW